MAGEALGSTSRVGFGAVAHRSAPELVVLHGLRIKGMADEAALAGRFGLDPDLVQELLLD